MNMNTEKIHYYDLLKQIKENKVNKKNLNIIDNHSKSWVWSDDICGFEHIDREGGFCGDDFVTYLTDEYSELDLVDLCVTIIPQENIEETPKYIATQEVIDMIETLYMDLDMEIDNCQGSMDGLDIAFEKLHIYKNIVKFLGGDIENHIDELTAKWFETAAKNRERAEKEKEKKDKIITKLHLPALTLYSIDEDIRKILWDQNDKINEICDIIIEAKLNEKDENNL